MKNPIYQPSGAAKEYGDLALNIYTGCPHRCYYCFAPQVLHRDRELFHSDVRPRDGIVEAVKEQLEQPHIREKLIHLCFSCDPYPRGYDSSETREIIKLLKESGNHAWEIFTVSYLQNCPVDVAFDKFRADVKAGQAQAGNTGDSLPDVDFAALKAEYDALDHVSGRAAEIEWAEFIKEYYSEACEMFDAGKGSMALSNWR